MKKNSTLLTLIGAFEKFSYNGIRSLLVIYLARQLAFSDTQAFTAAASLSSLGYLAPMIGGWAADRFLGNRAALSTGSVLAFFGSVLLLLGNNAGFHIGLGFLVLGAGFMKSSVPVLLGNALEKERQNTDAGFTLLYMGFNIGTFLGSLLCAVLGELIGWNYSFAIAGLAMLTCFVLQKRLENAPSEKKQKSFRQKALAFFGILLTAPLLGAAIRYNEILGYLFPILSLLAFVLLFQIARKGGPDLIRTVLSIFFLMIFHTVFFSLYEQGGLSLALFAERNVDRSLHALIGLRSITVGGHSLTTVPTTFFQTFDPFLNILLGSILSRFWKNENRPSSDMANVAVKFSLGLVAIALGFALLRTAGVHSSAGLVSPWILFAAYSIFVFGELCTIPVGLGMVSQKAPPEHKGFFMGVWFLSIGWAAWLAGFLSKLAAGTGSQEEATLLTYCEAFRVYSLLALAAAAALYVSIRIIMKMRSTREIAEPLSIR